MRKKSTGDSAFTSESTPGLPVKSILAEAEEEDEEEEEEEDGEQQGADKELP